MTIPGYRKIDPFVVGFADCDMLRHANNLAYPRWAEQARTDYLADVLGETIFARRSMILATMRIDYRLSLAYRERCAIGTRISRIGTKSLDIDHEIHSVERGLAATIATTLVAFDYEANATIAVPDDWRAIVAEFEVETGGGAARPTS